MRILYFSLTSTRDLLRSYGTMCRQLKARTAIYFTRIVAFERTVSGLCREVVSSIAFYRGTNPLQASWPTKHWDRMQCCRRRRRCCCCCGTIAWMRSCPRWLMECSQLRVDAAAPASETLHWLSPINTAPTIIPFTQLPTFLLYVSHFFEKKNKSRLPNDTPNPIFSVCAQNDEPPKHTDIEYCKSLSLQLSQLFEI